MLLQTVILALYRGRVGETPIVCFHMNGKPLAFTDCCSEFQSQTILLNVTRFNSFNFLSHADQGDGGCGSNHGMAKNHSTDPDFFFPVHMYHRTNHIPIDSKIYQRTLGRAMKVRPFLMPPVHKSGVTGFPFSR